MTVPAEIRNKGKLGGIDGVCSAAYNEPGAPHLAAQAFGRRLRCRRQGTTPLAG